MKQYLDLLQDILDNGVESEDRTGTGTLSVFGRQMRFDLSKGFPLLTTKKLHFKSIAIELLWFLRGDTNTEWLKKNGVRIWDSWSEKEDVVVEDILPFRDRVLLAERMGVKGIDFNLLKEDDSSISNLERLKKNIPIVSRLDALGIPRVRREVIRPKGDLGPIYGKQWRNWETIIATDPYIDLPDYEIEQYENAGFEFIDDTPIMGFWRKNIDQIKEVIKSIKEDPYSRRHIVNAWNVGELGLMNLMPCHFTFQFYVRNGKLSCMYTMRSNDFFLGSPYNIASYALLTHMIAHVCGLEVGELIYSGGDVHLYTNHIEQAKLQLTREPKPLPTLKFARDVKDIDDFKFEDFIIENYDAHPHIKGEVAV